MKTEIYYGKADVATYRTYGTPLEGLPEVPESTFVGRSNILHGRQHRGAGAGHSRSSPPTPRATTGSSWRPTR